MYCMLKQWLLLVAGSTPAAASEIKITPYERPSLKPVYHVPPSMTSYNDDTLLSSTPPSTSVHNDVGTSREQSYSVRDDSSYQLSS